ncbi:MAG: DUF488 domain-containing protein [Tepidisphaeraceae bacterium]
MIKVKHFLEPVEPDDGLRIWVEPHGVTKDLIEWCAIGRVFCHLGPPKGLCEWFEQHPDGYEYFRARYHEMLTESTHKPALQKLACAGMKENLTLLHQGDDPSQNSASALHEFLSELEAWCEPEGK